MPPADGFSLVFFQSASAATIPALTCSSRGGAQCYPNVSPRFALPSITYNGGGVTSNNFHLGIGGAAAGLVGPTDASIVNVQFLSTTVFGNPVIMAANDKWSYTLTFQPGGGAASNPNQVSYSISRGGATQSFTAQVDINAAINAAPSLGGGLTWLGFVAASGGATEEVWVTNVQFLSRCPPSSYAPTAMYNITETWVAGSAASYLAQCQPGFCGQPTTLACDPTKGTLSGAYPICRPMGLQPGQQAFPVRGTAPGVNTINVTCDPGFTPDPAVTTNAWATGTCTNTGSSTTVAMPPASAFACIPTGALSASLMQPVDPQWWLTSSAFWATSLQGASVIQLTTLGGFDSGLAMYGGFQININPGFAVQFDTPFRG